MSRSIIQTTITNMALRLELNYWEPFMFREGDTSIEEPTDTGLALQRTDQPASDEFACLLRVI